MLSSIEIIVSVLETPSISSILKLFLSGFMETDYDKKSNKSLSIKDLSHQLTTKALLNEDQKNVLNKITKNKTMFLFGTM